MSLSIYSKASVDGLLALKADLAGATFTGTVTAPNFTITAGSGGVLTFSDGTTMSTAGGGGGGATWGSITGSISSQTDLQSEFASYLPLAGGTMTGALYSTYGSQTATFFGSTISISDGTYTSSVQPSYFYTTNSFSTSYFTPTYIQFADGSTQTTAASGGMDYVGAERAGMCCALALALNSFDGNYTFQFTAGGGVGTVVAGGVPLFYDASWDQQVIGITQDFSTFYTLSATSVSGYSVVAQAPSFDGNFNSSQKIYLAFLGVDGWHTAYNACVYSP